MGSGASSIGVEPPIEERMTVNSPVKFPDLFTDGKLEHRKLGSEIGESTKYIHGQTPLNSSSASSEKYYENPDIQPSALELQAAAHWHRIIGHAKDQTNDTSIKLKPPKFVECQWCYTETLADSFCTGCGANVTEGDEGDDDDDIDEVLKYIPSSPTKLSFGKPTTPTTSIGDEQHNSVEEFKLHELLREITELKRKQSFSNISKMTIIGAQMARDEIKELEERAKVLEEKNIKSREEAIKKKKFSQAKESFLSNSINTLKALKGGSFKSNSIENIDIKSKNDDGDDIDDEIDYVSPDEVLLPSVLIELKSRTTTSIEIAWDINSKALTALTEVIRTYGNSKLPTYEVMFRPHDGRQDSAWSLAFPRTKASGGEIKNLSCNTPYVFKCRRLGWGTWGESVVIRTGPGPPSPPRSLIAKEVSSTSILIAWQVPETDNGLPIAEYCVQMKSWKGKFEQVYKGKDKIYLACNLPSNVIHIFEIKAINKIGEGLVSERLAIRTLPHGASESTPWVESIDPKTGKLFYVHPKTKDTSWTLPKGAIIDEVESLVNKRIYLSTYFDELSEDNCKKLDSLSHVIELNVSRDNLLEESLQKLFRVDEIEINAGPIRIKYENEEGKDVGGLAKDWFGEVVKSLLKGDTGLLQTTDKGFVIIDIRSNSIHKPSEMRWLFKALGIFIAKALIDGQTLGISFSPVLLSLLVGKKPSLEDLKEVDETFYNGLKWVSENDVTYADLTFSASYEVFGEHINVDLMKDGENKNVTEENKDDYIDLMQNWLVRERFEPAISYLIEGFNRHISPKLFTNFKLNEVQMLIGGQISIDVEEILHDAQFGDDGFSLEAKEIVWLWDILEGYDQQKLSKFLNFVTGCPCLPVGGLNPSLFLSKIEGIDTILPVAHTCFNQLVLPSYSCKEILAEKLEFALDNSDEKFHIE